MLEQLCLNVVGFPDVKPLTRIGKSIDARGRRGIVADRDRRERAVSVVILKRHEAVFPVDRETGFQLEYGGHAR